MVAQGQTFRISLSSKVSRIFLHRIVPLTVASGLLIAVIHFSPRESQDTSSSVVSDKEIPAISVRVQEDTTNALSLTHTVTLAKIKKLDAQTAELTRKLKILDPVNAPGISRIELKTPQTPELRRDPGRSKYREAQLARRTESGISRRALAAYSRETGVDPDTIEALMRR